MAKPNAARTTLAVSAASALALLLGAGAPAAAADVRAPTAAPPAAGFAPPAVAQPGPPATPAAPVAAAAGRRPRVALVLSGGGARGLAHLGVLKELQRQRVPVDLVVGTSMGAIIGAGLALGMGADEIERITRAADWDLLFSDQPARRRRSLRSRELERANFLGAEIGVRAGGLQFPRGAIYGQQIQTYLHGFEPFLGALASFDQLALPYRAVATDLETGRPVVLDHGELGEAMRASMSVPGVFAPVQFEHRLLVDGGLVLNLPIEVAQAMGADVVIAVDVGAPLLGRENLRSPLDVSQQVINILTGRSRDDQVRRLRPNDVLIVPDLKDIGPAAFSRADEIVALGQAAGAAMAARLAPLAVDEESYRLLAAARAASLHEDARIDAVRVDATALRVVNPRAVQAQLSVRPGPAVLGASIVRDVESVYAMDDFERVNWHVEQESDARVLVIEPVEKEWGPNYLQFGLDLSSDLSGASSFTARLAQRSAWLDAAGLEWRNNVSIGRRSALDSTLYQPLAPGSGWYLLGGGHVSILHDDLFLSGTPVATYEVRDSSLSLDLGRRLGTTTEVRLGLERGSSHAVPSVAQPGFPGRSSAIGVWQASLSDDDFDAWNFPRSGAFGFARVRTARTALGAATDYQLLEAGGDLALAAGSWRGVAGLRGGRAHGEQVPFDEEFALGGFLKLSGYNPREFLGSEYALGRLVLGQRIDLLGVKGGFLGGSLEAGRMDDRIDGSVGGLLWSGSVFLALPTPLGPTALGLGKGKSGRVEVYLFLGRP